jgi:dihydrofolate synthase/folylpolyglutamate synthase
MTALCAAELHDPWLTGVEALHVTGSNGKGSVCAMAGTILAGLGLRAAVYTSPHLERLAERLVHLDPEPREIPDAELDLALDEALARVHAYQERHPGDRVARFEALTCAALVHLCRTRPEALVLEAGIGGRLDATRVVPGRVVGLTSVDLEHTGLLGGTLELIALDKADLCPDRGVLVHGPLDPELRRRLAGALEVRGVELTAARQVCQVERTAQAPGGTQLDVRLDGRRLEGLSLPLLGRHQVDNAALAIALVRRWLELERPDLLGPGLEQAIRSGLARVRCPGRLERVLASPEVLVDLAHTPAAIQALVAAVHQLPGHGQLVLVTGVSHDKDRRAILGPLLGLADRVICTCAAERGAPADEICRLAREMAPELLVSSSPTVPGAVALALETARAEGMRVLVAGGLFLAAEARAVLRAAGR